MKIETNTGIGKSGIERKKGYEPDGVLIGNSNTGKLHSHGCRAICMMREDHKVMTNGAHFTPCLWCHATASSISDLIQDQVDDLEARVCRDPNMNKLFSLEGCLTCGSKDGIVKMFHDPHGVRLLGEEGHWWIYFECSKCGYQTAWWKAKCRSQARSGSK